MRVRLIETRLGLINSATRIPFRYGTACLTRCPQAVMAVTIEEAGGRSLQGYSGDCLPPSWFDKSPQKSYQKQIDDMLAVIALAEKDFREEFASPTEFFSGWLVAYERVQSRAAEWQLTPLLASFGVSLLERAMMDAMARAADLTFHQAVVSDLYKIRPAEIHGALPEGFRLADGLPNKPRQSVYVRHTVGLGDPLTVAEIPVEERLEDGFPQALQEYVERTGLQYFKVKVSNQLQRDLERLETIASLVEQRRDTDYRVTLDGNELYPTTDELHALIDAIRERPKLETLWNNTLVIEQPLPRGAALDEVHAHGIRELSCLKPVIIDESDASLDSYTQAIRLGYRGVSSKNCKGPVKSLINACLTDFHNRQAGERRYWMTGEDLCSVGILPVQADLCLAATLGLEHVERNGHHYHPGLSYLPEPQRREALQAHADFYAETNGIIAPRLVDGQFDIRSLQCTGFGFDVVPDLDAYQSPDAWEFSSLGLQS